MPAPVRVVFLGNDAWSVPTLGRLARGGDIDVVLVVTNPPRPAGRGSRLTATAVADAARRLALPLEETETTQGEAFPERLLSLAPDVSVVVAYGELLTIDVLNAPRLGSVNLHFSLLPRWRGRARCNTRSSREIRSRGSRSSRWTKAWTRGPSLRAERSRSGRMMTPVRWGIAWRRSEPIWSPRRSTVSPAGR